MCDTHLPALFGIMSPFSDTQSNPDYGQLAPLLILFRRLEFPIKLEIQNPAYRLFRSSLPQNLLLQS